MRGNGEMNLAKIAGLCEQKFVEWGHRTAIVKRFRTLLWEAAVVRVLRRAALEADEKEKEKRLNSGRQDWSVIGPLRPSRAEAVGTPASLVMRYLNMSDVNRRRAAFANSGPAAPHVHANDPNPLIVKIVSSRQHVSTDRLLEYRVEICPNQLVAITHSGIKGIHPEPANPASAAPLDDDFADLMDDSPKKAAKKPPPDPDSTMRMWLPGSMVRHVHPGLVKDFEAAEEAKKNKKSVGKGKGKEKATEDNYSSDVDLSSSPVKAPSKKRCPATKRGPKNTNVVPPTQDMARAGSSASVVDPWFTPDEHTQRGPSQSPSSDALSAYFLCSENPDGPASALDSDDDMSSDIDLPAEEDKPRDRFDIMFDQIMGITGMSSRSRKSTTTRRKRPTGSSMDDIEGESQGQSSTARTVKRRKTSHTSVPDRPASAKQNRPRPHFRRAVDADPDVIELSDFEDLPSSFTTASRSSSFSVSSTSRSRPAKSVAPSQTRTANRYYPEPSSSQDSRLFPDDADVIIDLT
jgi:Holliday junction resolvase YEN1